MSQILKFVLKGSRNYVHGTSLFNALSQAAGERGLPAGNINVSFKHVIYNPVCVLEQRPPMAEDSVVAKISAQNAEGFVLCISEALETEETTREEFDEELVCKGAVVSAKSITQENPQHLDLIELIVSHCKKMHLESVDASKKWVFSRYDGQFPIPKPEKLELRIIKQVGTRLTCSDVLINDVKIGNIYFS